MVNVFTTRCKMERKDGTKAAKLEQGSKRRGKAAMALMGFWQIILPCTAEVPKILGFSDRECLRLQDCKAAKQTVLQNVLFNRAPFRIILSVKMHYDYYNN